MAVRRRKMSSKAVDIAYEQAARWVRTHYSVVTTPRSERSDRQPEARSTCDDASPPREVSTGSSES